MLEMLRTMNVPSLSFLGSLYTACTDRDTGGFFTLCVFLVSFDEVVAPVCAIVLISAFVVLCW